MRVALVTHYYPAHKGGVERIAGELAARLASAGVADLEWHASACDAAPAEAPGLHSVPAPACNFAERHLGFPWPIWSPSALLRLVRAVREADVVHLHDFAYLPCLVAYGAARLARRPLLVTQHIGFVPYRNPLLRALLGAVNRVLGALALGGATRVVFESASVQRYFSGFVRYRAEPLLIPNGVDTARFAPAARPERAAPLLLFVGRFVEKKGLAVLHELARRLPQARWVLAGHGPIDPAAWDLPNVSVVHSPGIAELIPLYQAADLLVLPSVGEGIPLVIQEAMACGTPVLAGAETAAGVPGAEGLLLGEAVGSPDTAERWAARLQALLRAPQALEALRPRVAAFAREHWSWARCAARYAEALRACASQP